MDLRSVSFMQDIHTGNAAVPHRSKIGNHWSSIPFFYTLTMVPLIWLGSLCWVPLAFPGVAIESEIETLEVIEVTGTTVTKVARTLSFPLPTFSHSWPTTTVHHLALPDLQIVNHLQPAIPVCSWTRPGRHAGVSKVSSH